MRSRRIGFALDFGITKKHASAPGATAAAGLELLPLLLGLHEDLLAEARLGWQGTN